MESQLVTIVVTGSTPAWGYGVAVQAIAIQAQAPADWILETLAQGNCGIRFMVSKRP